MGLKWLKYLKDEVVGNDEGIEEVEVKIEYSDGTKRKWTFVGDNDPIYEDGEDEEEDGSEEDDEDGSEDDSEDDEQ